MGIMSSEGWYEDRDGSFRNNNLGRAFSEHPFNDIFNKYHLTRGELDADGIDAVARDLETLLQPLEEQLSHNPAYTGIYRYDPFSFTYSNTWGGVRSNGPNEARIRIFDALSFENVNVVKDEKSVRVEIDQPSALITGMGKHAIQLVNEPTILFHSRTLKLSPSDKSEENMFGIVITHGDRPFATLPDDKLGVTSSTVVLGVGDYAFDLRKEGRKKVKK